MYWCYFKLYCGNLGWQDLLKINSFAQGEFSDQIFLTKRFAKHAIKTCETLRNFAKLCLNHKKCLFFFFCFAFQNTNFVQMFKKLAQTWVCTPATFRSSGGDIFLSSIFFCDFWKMSWQWKGLSWVNWFWPNPWWCKEILCLCAMSC